MNEHDYEPLPGLPAPLPPGESILWQGAPCWRSLALRAMRVRQFAIYFIFLAAWGVVGGLTPLVASLKADDDGNRQVDEVAPGDEVPETLHCMTPCMVETVGRRPLSAEAPLLSHARVPPVTEGA